MIRHIAVQEGDFDTGAVLAALSQGAGGVASFTGVVRGEAKGRKLAALRLEHYSGMTEAALEKLADEAASRWDLTGIAIIHRIGRLTQGENIVLAAAASRHRAAALEATAFLIDRLKTDAPFWKAEEFEDGTVEWVEARASDDEAAARWGS